ncbi:MCE family protein [Pseudonocardia sp. NPDC049154]|uniref:MCE family protein n=1 Tax=Pseudonocardia sp. NPDC049154 TaxID=3155501 RepID=UPI0033E75010
MNDTLRTRVVGVAMIGVLVGLFALAAAFYAQVFVSRVPVTLKADRAGLVMDAGNSVTLRGVQVGTITDVRPDGDGVELVLGLDPDEIERIPANVLAEIQPATIFGAKNVALALPDSPSATPLRSGAVLDNRQVTVEVNTVFDNLAVVLRTVDPSKINATLGELSKALDGRGDDIAGFASTADGYLAKINRKLPVLQRDLQDLATTTQTFADISPDFIRVLDNLTVTGGSIVDEADQLDGFLLDVTALAGNANDLLSQNRAHLVTALDLLRSPAALLNRYNPGLGCFVTGLDETRKLLEPVVGGESGEVRLNTTLSIGQAPYTAPDDLPEIAAGNGPACHGLLYLDPDERPSPHLRTDTGADPNPNTGNDLRVGTQDFARILFGPLATAAGGDR